MSEKRTLNKWLAGMLFILAAISVHAQSDHMFRLVEGGPFNDHLEKLTTELIISIDPDARLSFDQELVKIRSFSELRGDELLAILNDGLPVMFALVPLHTEAPAIRSGTDPPMEIIK